MNKLDIEALKSQLAYAQDAVQELEEALKQVEEQKPWEPKGGEWYLSHTRKDTLDYGVEFATRESAEHTAPFFRFYHRLCQLAIELNPSGKVVKKYNVCFHYDKTWDVSVCDYDISAVFETEEAAQKACDILNRDRWELPK